MDERDWLAERFEEHRPRLRAVPEPIIDHADSTDPIVDRSPEAARRLASRARRRVRAENTVPDADPDAQREVVEAFLAAARDGRIVEMDWLADAARLRELDLTILDD
jgi:hypothetical protein